MDAFDSSRSTFEPLIAPCLGRIDHIFIKRDDLIHPVVSGNKWRKLKYHIQSAIENGQNHLVTFGGAYSNHMVATACAGAVLGFKTTCFVRGDELTGKDNHFLQLAQLYGMYFIPTDRQRYREAKQELFNQHFGHNDLALFVAEGGSGPLGLLGVAELVEELPITPHFLYHASATATTAAGLSLGFSNQKTDANTRIRSIAVLRNAQEQKEYLNPMEWVSYAEIVEGYEQGGYAKTSTELILFVKQFIKETGIIIDPVYTGKALFALKNDISTGLIQPHESVVFLHTGGMLGIFSDKMMQVLQSEL